MGMARQQVFPAEGSIGETIAKEYANKKDGYATSTPSTTVGGSGVKGSDEKLVDLTNAANDILKTIAKGIEAIRGGVPARIGR